MKLEVLGVVLAGGKSTRMGRSKSDLQLNGASLLDHAVGLLRRTLGNAVPVGVLGPAGFSGPQVFSVPDVLLDQGPLGGIHALVCSSRLSDLGLQAEWFLIIPIDMPGLQVPTLQRLLAAKEEGEWLTIHEHEFPALVKNTAHFKSSVTGLLASQISQAPLTPRSQRSMNALRKQVKYQELTLLEESEMEFLNLNTYEQWLNYVDLKRTQS